MEQINHLAIDIGSSSGRAFVGRLENGILVSEEIHRFRTRDVFFINQRVRNIYRWFDEILLALTKYKSNYGRKLNSIGVDSMGEDFALIDKVGNIITIPPSYRDLANIDSVLEIEEKNYGNENLYKICGNQSVNNDTLRQLIAMTEMHNSPLSNAGGILFLGDIFHYLLCGNKSVEHSLASYGKLYNQIKKDWDDSIFDAFCIPDNLKSNIVYSGDKLGKVHKELCEDVGLDCNIEVITPCTHDTACAALTVPDEDNDWLFISSGSWSLIGMETDMPVLSKLAWKHNFSNSSMPIRQNMFKSLTAGMWIIQKCQREWNDYSFDKIVTLAKSTESTELYIDTDAPDFFNPVSMTEAISASIKLRYGVLIDSNDVGTIARICFESLALKYRYVIENLEKAADKGQAANKIYILGGGSLNHLLNQFIANVCNKKVFSGIDEASAIGNLLCQMYGNNELKSKSEMKDVIKRSFSTIQYKPQDESTWEQKYSSYLCSFGFKSM